MKGLPKLIKPGVVSDRVRPCVKYVNKEEEKRKERREEGRQTNGIGKVKKDKG